MSIETPRIREARTTTAAMPPEMPRNILRLPATFSCLAAGLLLAPYSQGLRSALICEMPRSMMRLNSTPNTKFSSTPTSSV